MYRPSFLVAMVIAVSACSTAGGLYKEGDATHGEFSAKKTILTVIGAIGTALIMSNNSGGDGTYYDPNQYGNFSTTEAQPTQAATNSPPSKEEQLAELKRLFEGNLISETYYTERKKAILADP